MIQVLNNYFQFAKVLPPSTNHSHWRIENSLGKSPCNTISGIKVHGVVNAKGFYLLLYSIALRELLLSTVDF